MFVSMERLLRNDWRLHRAVRQNRSPRWSPGFCKWLQC